MAQANGHSNLKFWGYRRENGRVGVRNHVVILPLDDLSNAACEAVANNIKGTLALPHAYGRLQFGEDLELHFRTLIGTGSNPNVLVGPSPLVSLIACSVKTSQFQGPFLAVSVGNGTPPAL